MSERKTQVRYVYEVCPVSDAGRIIGEDCHRAKYLDSDVEAVIRFREEGYTFKAISQMMDMPIRTVRDYISGRRRNQSIADYKRIRRLVRCRD